ncbi:tripartite tricarboxylate transporter substrate binding protein [Azospirillum brasilense]|uniref:Tripartite tricarboxylate transporter substrate-binding protein n=1 Tax=Azospirillum brasilense TaxID=192 RepID=A0A4D8QMZ3_AZOBR|nr:MULTISPECIES: tripartite tricarboxylate transporter substrate-binding protein [Azospirillum]MDW7554274.1 tripartite tricarboxylate transporter substrate-binding protein [Azospirillum brasilense]MDW7594491.1 tripartite tricarboxylate transporter substrate-binding protein [Azospirillum brasilense]MDW7629345.1 tripartite tricarboxylate transporter substrate-binding protein [Azospirillum brasilense]MDW7630001.1 tripartite tricarboxylate transporter substrate-binding protein [Azospirillum brasile
MKDVQRPRCARKTPFDSFAFKNTPRRTLAGGTALAGALGLLLIPNAAQAAWEPTKSVEFVVPAGTGGGADQMARMIQGIIQKNNLMGQPIVVINKSGGAGAEGFLDVKSSNRNPHKIIITLSNLFTTPLATGVPFSWKDMTPVAMLALDNFVLWVNSEAAQKSPKEFVEAAKEGGANRFKMGGTGSKQEDQIITAAIEQSAGVTFTYVPYKGGGDVAAQLVGNHINASVNNPIEAVSQWRAGALRPLCVFDKERIPLKEPVADGKSWNTIPTCKESGLDVEYTMLRGIFMGPGVTPEQIAYYVDLFKKVRETEEWKDFMAKGAFNVSFKTGDEFKTWLTAAETQHKTLMDKAGFTKQ